MVVLSALLGCSAALPDRPVPSAPEPQPASTPAPSPVALPAEEPPLPSFRNPPFGPDILVVGDSQISFGAGAGHLALFGNLARSCGANAQERRLLENLDAQSVAAIGVRSSSLNHWSARDAGTKGVICDKDARFGVNAGTYGVSGPTRSYVQIGEDRPYEFCRPNQSPFEAMFREGYYRPKLVVLAFLGNSVDRWSDPATATADLRASIAQMPDESACVVMSTAAAFDAEVNAKRQLAQRNLARAVAATGGRCSFAEALTPDLVASVTGNPNDFRINEAGEVLDRFHPNTKGFERFFQSATPAICAAVFDQIGPP
ncbi:SGNH/GDSL hydrolase family protein [Roseovarius phycicola]